MSAHRSHPEQEQPQLQQNVGSNYGEDVGFLLKLLRVSLIFLTNLALGWENNVGELSFCKTDKKKASQGYKKSFSLHTNSCLHADRYLFIYRCKIFFLYLKISFLTTSSPVGRCSFIVNYHPQFFLFNVFCGFIFDHKTNAYSQ